MRDGAIQEPAAARLQRLRTSSSFVVVVFGRGCYFPPSWVFLKTFVSVASLIREAGGTLIGVLPDAAADVAALKDALPFPLLSDAALATHELCAREMGLRVPIARAAACAAHFGRPFVTHHAVVVATADRVLYRWVCNPSRANQGGASGFVPGEIVWRISARRLATLRGKPAPIVDGPFAKKDSILALIEREGGAAWLAAGGPPDDGREYGGSQSCCSLPLFGMLLLANGRFRSFRPFVFEHDGGGERVDSQSVKAYVRLFVVALVVVAMLWARSYFGLHALVDALFATALAYVATFVVSGWRLFAPGGAYGELAAR